MYSVFILLGTWWIISNCKLRRVEGSSECTYKWQTSNRVICACSFLPLGWVPGTTNTYPPHRNVLLIYHYEIGKLMGEFADGAHIWERVKNRETPTIIGGECGNVIQYRKIDQFNESVKGPQKCTSIFWALIYIKTDSTYSFSRTLKLLSIYFTPQLPDMYQE